MSHALAGNVCQALSPVVSSRTDEGFVAGICQLSLKQQDNIA